MSTLRKQSLVFLVAAVLMLAWSAAPILAAEEGYRRQEPTGAAMGFDLIVLRPLGIVATVGGAVLFVISSPFSALGGNIDEAADKLVSAPFNYTFNRPLGYERR